MTDKRRAAKSLLLAAAALFAVVLGCNTAPDTGAEYREEANDAATLTAEERAERRDALAQKWQTAENRLEELRAKVTADGVQNELDETLAEIDREAQQLGRELDQFGEDSRLAWNDFEDRVERNLDDLGREIDEAAAHFDN